MHVYSAGGNKMNNERYKGSVLAIDDDPAVVADLARILSVGGYACHCCRDLTVAVERFVAEAPDLVIADLGLVGPNGYRLVEAIRREIGYVETPMMFLSDTQGPGVIHRHGTAGGAYFLRKPLDVVVLLELVDKALYSRRLCDVRSPKICSAVTCRSLDRTVLPAKNTSPAAL